MIQRDRDRRSDAQRRATAEARLRVALEHLEQLLLVIDHADEHHGGQLTDHHGETIGARRFLRTVRRP